MGTGHTRNTYPDGSAFGEAVDAFLEAYWAHDPIEATRSGVHTHDDELPDRGPEAAAAWGETIETFEERFRAFDPDQLTDTERLDREWALGILEWLRVEHELRYWARAPQTYLDTLGTGLHSLLLGEFAPAEDRFESLLARLRAIPDFLEDAQANIEPENVAPVWIESALIEAENLGQFLEEAIPEAAGEVPALAEDVVAASEDAAAAVDAYATYVTGLEEHADGEFAAGRERFDRLLGNYHMLEMDADDLEAFGWEWIERYEEEMAEVAAEIDPDEHWVDVLADVKDDHPAAEELREAYEEETMLAREHCKEHDLITFPEGESVDVEWMPSFMRDANRIALPRVPPAFGEGLDGKWYITPVDPDATPEQQEEHLRDHSWAWIRGIAQHEMYPGHHLHQCIHKQVATPLRLQFWSPIFSEGWGLYTEELFEETGLISEPEQRLMQLRNGLWRAVRIVIDAGIHTQGMSVEEATDLLVERAHLERHWAENQVRGYTRRPSYISTYRVGLSLLRDIRERYEAEQGEAFTLKDFHDSLMAYSALPLGMVESEFF